MVQSAKFNPSLESIPTHPQPGCLRCTTPSTSNIARRPSRISALLDARKNAEGWCRQFKKKNLTWAWPFLWRISPAKMRSSTLSKRGLTWFDHWIFDLRLQKFLQFWLENCGKMMIEHEKIRGTTFFLINHHWESSFMIDVPLLLYQYFSMIYKSGYINHKNHKWYTSYFSMYHFCYSESPCLMWKSTINGSCSIAILT